MTGRARDAESRRRFGRVARRILRTRANELLMLAIPLGLVAHVGATTLRPLYHNAAATLSELQGDPAAAERT